MNTSDFQSLINWYERERRDLPWRETRDPYAVMVSEFMLQQTTVAAVTPRFLQWMKRFPSFQALARAGEPEVVAQWSGLGYYQRARRLHQAAREVTRLGYLPDTFEGLKSLPGVGAYTAAAVSSICFERPELAVDTNVIRVLFRYYAIKKPPQDGASHRKLRDKLRPQLELQHPGELNQALMELGATICSVREPGCLVCPIRAGCLGRRSEGGPTGFPEAKTRKPPRLTPGIALVLVEPKRGEVLMVKGTSLGLLAPLFQPPILFSEREGSENFHGALTELLALLPSSAKNWKVSYGISGRKLNLDCREWSLSSQIFVSAEKLLQERGLSAARFWPAEPDPNLPLSSLTRKILKKSSGSP